MIVQINIPDNAIKQDDIIDNNDILNLIDSGFYYMARVSGHYNLERAEIKLSIKE